MPIAGKDTKAQRHEGADPRSRSLKESQDSNPGCHLSPASQTLTTMQATCTEDRDRKMTRAPVRAMCW